MLLSSLQSSSMVAWLPACMKKEEERKDWLFVFIYIIYMNEEVICVSWWELSLLSYGLFSYIFVLFINVFVLPDTLEGRKIGPVENWWWLDTYLFFKVNIYILWKRIHIIYLFCYYFLKVIIWLWRPMERIKNVLMFWWIIGRFSYILSLLVNVLLKYMHLYIRIVFDNNEMIILSI